MKIIKIAHYDDNKGDRTNVSSYIKSLNNDFKEKGIGISLDLTKYENHEILQEHIENGTYFELLILDMYNDTDGSRVGENVLNTINATERKINTIIFTQAFYRDKSSDFKSLYLKYNFILGERITKDDTDSLISRIRKHVTKDEDYDQFMIDDDDIFLRAEILGIGRANLNEILYQIKNNIKFSGKFLVQRMSYGFSGAAIFKLCYDNFTKILKISREKDTLKSEHERAKNFYKLFPQRFIISVENEEYLNNEVFAILIDEVEGLPLFDWLIRTKERESIETLFEKLYLSTGGLKDHYKKRQNSNKEKFTYIFYKFDAIKFSLVKKAIKELTPIIDKQSDREFNEWLIKNLVLNGIYEDIDKNNLIDNIYKKELTLCHGDFHSKNILIQGDNPVIIDTGSIEYSYWCTDICRLIVNLFIIGFDDNTYEYYDLHSIKSDLDIAKEIISLKELTRDGKNDSFIFAINWLLKNIQKIYESLFSKWEFQLGLAKEFLQVSYKINSIPPGKRALSLLAAYQSIICANTEIELKK